MTTVGLVGLGKLGLPVAVALASKFRVLGYDTDAAKRCYREYEHVEKGPDGGNDFQVYFKDVCNYTRRVPTVDPGLYFVRTLEEAVKESDIIFLAIQTPHDPELDGSKPFTKAKDFDYSYLIKAATDLAPLVHPSQTVAIISTVLPGTIRREIIPILKGKCKVVYNPFFIAMGTVMHDFLNPEFVLLGGEERDCVDITKFYQSLHAIQPIVPTSPPTMAKLYPPTIRMSIESAELTKVAYDTFITAKICVANTIMEIAHKTPGCNVDDVTNALGHATQRIVSDKYLTGGMGDGGACHPRDCIAMSWMAHGLDLHYDLFGNLMVCRDGQTSWLSMLLSSQNWPKPGRERLPIVILGKSFKPESNITAGSPAILLANMLRNRGYEFEHIDPYVDNFSWPPRDWLDQNPKVFFIATKHRCFAKYGFPEGSVVIDPFRFIGKQSGIEVISVGVGEPVN
jgi:UDPglucose 6-dehydrogenase